MINKTPPPKWLAVQKVMSFFSARRAKYRQFVVEGIGKTSVWEELKGQIYLGDEDFLGRMQNLVDRKVVHGVARAQRKPNAPGVNDLVTTVARAYGISPSQVLNRSHAEAYGLAVYLLRRVGNLSLRDVAGRVGMSAARVSQIQTKIEEGKTNAKTNSVLKHYN